MKNYYYTSIFFFLLWITTSCQNPNPKIPNDQPPNILILFTDDQRFNTIRDWGNEEIHTPNLDRLAAMGTSFTHAHNPGGNNGALCMPSRAMLLTGRFYQHLPLGFTNMGMVTQNRGVSPYPTFAETFQVAGYETFFTGKWHNGPPELHDGFTTGANIYLGGMHFLKDGGHTNPWVHDFDPTGKYPADKKWQANKFSSELYADAAVDFLQQHNKEQPFLMYVSFTSPHDPRQAPEKYQKLYDPSKITLPENFLPEHPFDNGMIRVRDEDLAPYPRTPDRIREEIAGYYAMVSEVDAQIGRIIDALQAKGQLGNTIIVFAGDNGLAVGQHGLLGKQNIYDHSVRVPLIIAGPGIKGNQQSSSLCYLLDVFPTICDLTGIPQPESIEGKSLVPVLEDPTALLREHVFLSFIKTQRGVRTNDNWKLIQYFVDGQNTGQFFNLNVDPWETKNLYDDPAFQSKKEALQSILMSYLIEMEDEFLEPNIQISYRNFGEPPTIAIQHALTEADIYFTIDGTEPSIQSTEYGTPFEVNTSGVVKVKAFYDGKAISKVVETPIAMIDRFTTVSWAHEPAKRYAARGKFSLVDGIRGSDNFKDGHWLGFQELDFVSTLSLKEVTNLESIGANFLENTNDWIFLPKEVAFAVSLDGVQFQEIFRQKIPPAEPNQRKEGPMLVEHLLEQPVDARHIRVSAINTGTCPDWHPGKGGKAWLFVDEITVN